MIKRACQNWAISFPFWMFNFSDNFSLSPFFFFMIPIILSVPNIFSPSELYYELSFLPTLLDSIFPIAPINLNILKYFHIFISGHDCFCFVFLSSHSPRLGIRTLEQLPVRIKPHPSPPPTTPPSYYLFEWGLIPLVNILHPKVTEVQLM